MSEETHYTWQMEVSVEAPDREAARTAIEELLARATGDIDGIFSQGEMKVTNNHANREKLAAAVVEGMGCIAWLKAVAPSFMKATMNVFTEIGKQPSGRISK